MLIEYRDLAADRHYLADEYLQRDTGIGGQCISVGKGLLGQLRQMGDAKVRNQAEFRKMRAQDIASMVRRDVFDYIERFYNPTRRHSTLGYLSPMGFEKQAQVA